MSKIVSILILLSLALSITACSSGDTGQQSADTTTAQETEVTGETEPPEILPDVPEMDFEGYEFTFLVRFNEGPHWAPWNARDVYVEQQIGEPINDAVYDRNRFIEEKYNCVIREYSSASHAADLRKTVAAGDTTYSVYYAGLNELIAAALEGSLVSFNDVPYIDLEAPWWNGNAARSLSVAHQIFFAPSDLIVMDNDCTSSMVFNKQLIIDHSLESPYTYVNNDTWTIDKLIDMSKGIASDVNGDGLMDYNDKYGFVSYRDAVLSFMHAAGGRIAEKDSNDLPVLTLGSEKCFNALGKAFDLMYDDGSFNVHHLEGKFDAIYEVTEQMFMEDRSLFYWILLHDIEKFRDMDSDFGIIPLPKYDERQEEYGHTVNQYHSHGISVPMSVESLERTGIILEALTAKSKYTLQPAYYDTSLQRKFSRDEESADMLDIIFASRVYDIGAINNWGGYSWDIIALTMTNNRDIASLYSKKETAATTDMAKTIEKYQNINQ